MSAYVCLYAAIVLTVTAQLTLKYSSTRTYCGVWVVINIYNAIAYTLFLGVTVLYVRALQEIPLTTATAWISLTYVLVVIASVVIFKEGQLFRKLISCVLIVIGVWFFEYPV